MRLEHDECDALIESGAPPTLDAKDADGVERELSRLYYDREFAENIGRRTREWFLGAQSSRRWSNVYHVLLRAMTLGDSVVHGRIAVTRAIVECGNSLPFNSVEARAAIYRLPGTTRFLDTVSFRRMRRRRVNPPDSRWSD
jgi:hypothetical protein